MSIQSVGSNVQIIYQTKFPTFTPDQLMKALKEKEYTPMQGQAADLKNPDAPPITIPAFSKENVNVLYNPNQNQLVVQIINTIDLSRVLQDLKPILVSLNITEDVMAKITFNCKTSVWSSNEPLKTLTALVNSNFLKGINGIVGHELKVATFRLITEPQPDGDNIQIVLEPLASNLKKQYFFNMAYQTMDMRRFNEFISGFGQNMILSVIKQVQEVNV